MGLSLTSLSRRSITLALLAWPTTALAAACPPAKVLFVCPAGTVKSAIAREVLRSRALTAGLAVEGASRGLTPEDHVSPALAANLYRDVFIVGGDEQSGGGFWRYKDGTTPGEVQARHDYVQESVLRLCPRDRQGLVA